MAAHAVLESWALGTATSGARGYLAPLDLPLDFPAVAKALEGATGSDVLEVVRRTVLEHGETFTQAQLLDVAATGRWQATVNRRRYL